MESEFDGVGVNRSGVHSKGRGALSAQERRQLAIRTADTEHPEEEPTELALHGQDPKKYRSYE